MSSETDKPFKRFVRLLARAFYDEPPPVDKKLKPGQSDNSGIGVVVMDALTKVEWIKEDDLATELKVRRKQLGRVLQTFEREKLINREHRREDIPCAKSSGDDVATTIEDEQKEMIWKEKKKFQSIAYCSIDYAQCVDVGRYRIYHMKKKLRGFLDNGRDEIPNYICTKCDLRYSAFDVMELLSETDDTFHCEKCDISLVAESAAVKKEDEAHQLFFEKVEEQLKPLTNQLALLKDLSPPDYLSLQAWEASHAVHVANESQGKTMPSIEEEKVLTAENSKGNDAANVKSLPPWMMKQGMNLTDEQHGEVKGDLEAEKATDSPQNDDAKNTETTLREEYIKAYQTELMKRYESQYSKAAAEDEDAPTERRVGQKAKREESDEEESDHLDPFATGGVDSKIIDEESKEKTSIDVHVEDAVKKDVNKDINSDNSEDDDDGIEWE